MLVGANDEALVLAASVGVDTTSLLEERLAEAGYDIDLDALSWGTEYRGAEGHAIFIAAPLEMPGIEIGLEELGLTEQEHQWLVNYSGDSNVDIWANTVGTDEWVPVELEEVDWVESVVTRPDGTMLLTLYTMGRPISLQSSNGIEWTEVDPGESPQLIHQWAGGLVGIDHRPGPELLISEDGDTWEEAGLADHFPSQIQWWAGALAGGDDGVAISITGYRENVPTPDREPDREPVEITTDEGHVLTLDLEGRFVELEAGGTTHTWEIYRADPPDGIDADVVEQTVTFSDPDTGEELAEVPFHVLVQAEQDFRTMQFGSEEHQVLVFTPDGSDWTIQPARDAFGVSSWVAQLEVAAGRVFAATLDLDEAGNYPFDFAEFKLWSAEIP